MEERLNYNSYRQSCQNPPTLPGRLKTRCKGVLRLQVYGSFPFPLIDFNPPGRGRTQKDSPTIPVTGHLLAPLRAARRGSIDLGTIIHFRDKPVKSIRACSHGAEVRLTKVLR